MGSQSIADLDERILELERELASLQRQRIALAREERTVQLLHFEQGDRRLELLLERTIEVLPMLATQRLDSELQGLIGLVDRRGRPTPSLDGAVVLHSATRIPLLDRKILVVQVGPWEIGLAVDRVHEVASGTLQPLQASGLLLGEDALLLGRSRSGEHEVLVLDPTFLLDRQQIAAFAEIAGQPPARPVTGDVD